MFTLPTHKLKLSGNPRLDSLKLLGELTPNLLLRLLTVRAGNELGQTFATTESVFCPISSYVVQTYFSSLQSCKKTP